MSLNQKCNSYIHFAVKANKVLWGLDMIKTSKYIPYVIIYDKSLEKQEKLFHKIHDSYIIPPIDSPLRNIISKCLNKNSLKRYSNFEDIWMI